jgi:hypothetical protein
MVVGSFDRREIYKFYTVYFRPLVALFRWHLMSMATSIFAGVSGLIYCCLYVYVLAICKGILFPTFIKMFLKFRGYIVFFGINCLVFLDFRWCLHSFIFRCIFWVFSFYILYLDKMTLSFCQLNGLGGPTLGRIWNSPVPSVLGPPYVTAVTSRSGLMPPHSWGTAFCRA